MFWLCTPTSLHLATFGTFCSPTTASKMQKEKMAQGILDGAHGAAVSRPPVSAVQLIKTLR